MAHDPQTPASDIIPLLDGLTVSELGKVIAAAERQREARRESGKRELVEEFKAKAEALGLSLDALLGNVGQTGGQVGRERQPRKGAAATTTSPRVKYRHPDTGETWSGRGRMPKWLSLAVERGGDREEFAAKS